MSIEKDQATQEENQEIKTKIYHELKDLQSIYNTDETRVVNDIEQRKDIILNQANIVLLRGAA
jgi:hypothetical protein